MVNAAAQPQFDAREERLLGVLEALTEIGMELARDLRREVAEGSDTLDSGDIALRFSRIAMAVQRSVALEARLAREFKDAAAQSAHARNQARIQASASLARET